MKKIFAFIFARGGSKGLPRKNILPFNGKPLIAHSIDVAKKIENIEKIFVSTDDDLIRTVAIEYGANVINRPKNLAKDDSPEIEAWRHAIKYLQDKNIHFDVFVSLPATAPLRNDLDVRNCIKTLDEDVDMVITATPASRSPYFNMVSRDENGFSKIIIDSQRFTCRQDVPDAYDMTTVAYVARPKYIMKCKNLFDGKVKSVLVPKERAIDIDDRYDFALAETILRNNYSDV